MQLLQTSASSLIVSAQNGHSIYRLRSFGGITAINSLKHCLPKPKPAAARGKSGLCLAEFGPKQFALDRKFPMLGLQQRGNCNVAMTRPANNNLLGIFLSAKGTGHKPTAHGIIFKANTEPPILPSESFTSMRI